MGDLLEKFGSWLEGIAFSHPRAVGGFAAFFVCGSIVSNILRSIWPSRDGRPRWVAGILAGLDPFIGNLWNLVIWAAAKVGITIKPPYADLSASIRQADKMTGTPP